MRVLVVIGTRPESIKLAPVILSLKKKHQVTVCLTGQHKDLAAQTLAIFGLEPDIQFQIPDSHRSLDKALGRILSDLTKFCSAEKFDWVVVQGDTTSALGGALAAFYSKTKVAHVEAGLRTHDISSPYPEELNRQVIARIADIHFCPTQGNVENLLVEGIPSKRVHLVGNTVVDAVSRILGGTHQGGAHEEQQNTHSPYILVTAHRRENFGSGILSIVEGIKLLLDASPGLHVMFITHSNPAVKNVAYQELGDVRRVTLLEPQPYDSFIRILAGCLFVLTDSGGVQEEAFSTNKRVLVLRDSTERIEGASSGRLQTIGTHPKNILSNSLRLIKELNEESDLLQEGIQNPFGDGESAARITAVLESIGKFENLLGEC